MIPAVTQRHTWDGELPLSIAHWYHPSKYILNYAQAGRHLRTDQTPGLPRMTWSEHRSRVSLLVHAFPGCEDGGMAPGGRAAGQRQLRRHHQAVGGPGGRVGVRADSVRRACPRDPPPPPRLLCPSRVGMCTRANSSRARTHPTQSRMNCQLSQSASIAEGWPCLHGGVPSAALVC